MAELGLKNRAELSKAIETAYSLVNHISHDERPITSEYKVRCVQNLRRDGFRFNIFWFEDPERHPFWVREDYWMNLYPPQVQLLATIRPDFVELLEKASQLTPERREKWLRVVKELFELQDS